jgi:hypothetical protein
MVNAGLHPTRTYLTLGITMKQSYKIFIVSLTLFISACATPPEVKQLSLKQLDYLDVLTKAVTVQSDGLVSVAEKLKKEAGGKIACYQQNSIDRLNELVTKTMPLMTREKRIETKQMIFSQAESINNTAELSQKKLATDFQAIKTKTEELQGYITKIKEVQSILNAYVQSEKMGEQLLKTTVGHANISGFLSTINTYIPELQSTTKDLKRLLDVLNQP